MSRPQIVRFYIRRQDSRYTCSGDNLAQFTINLSIEDVRRLNRKMRSLLGEVAADFAHRIQLTSRESQKALKELAFEGAIALKSIFGPNELRWIRGLQSNSKLPRVLHIHAEDFVLPWELLYDDFQASNLNFRNFWGYKYIIQRSFPPKINRDPLFDSVISVRTSPRVGLIADSKLKHVAEIEIPLFQKLQEDSLILLSTLRNLDKSNREIEIDGELRKFLSQKLNIVHFACHTGPAPDGEPEGKAYLILANEFPVSIDEINVYEISLPHAPLVILNACDTGVRDPSQTFSFVETFLRLGACGVVATDCEVPDAFAAAFTKQIYAGLLGGQDLGDILMSARKHFIRRHRNPLGLLYSMYADPEIRIERKRYYATQSN
jgi:hypothetical protein